MSEDKTTPSAGSSAGSAVQAGSGASNHRLSRYIGGYTVLAVCVLVIAIAKLPPPNPALAWALAGFVGLFAVASLATVDLRVRSQQVSVTWDEATLILGLVLLPSSEVVLAALAGKLIAELIRRVPAGKLAFNVGKQTVAACAAATAGSLIAGGRIDPFSVRGAVALITGALVFGLVANLSVVIAVRFATGEPVRWLPVYGLGMIAIPGNASIAYVTLIVLHVDPYLLLAVPPLVLCLRLVYIARLRSRTERETWQRIAAAIDRFSDVDLVAVLRVAITSAADLFSAAEVELLVQLGGERPGLVRGTHREVTWSGFAADAPPPTPRKAPPRRSRRSGRGAEAISVPLGRQADDAADDQSCGADSPGELRLRFGGRVRLTERERYALRTFAAALGTALRNAYAYAESQRRASRNAHDAGHDPLTGLANRRQLFADGDELLRSRPLRGTQAMVLVDLDHFKDVNDTLGHLAGDEVLTAIGRRLAASTGPDDLVARLGGDEFAVLFVALPAPALAVHRARQLLATLDPPIEVDGIRITVSGSAGVATAPTQGGVEELLRRADVAMYQAKREGVKLNQYSRTRDTADITGLALGGDLRAALAGDQFAVHFQPIVDISAGTVTSAEALARWRHPDRGEMSPHTFLTAIEKSGLLPEFTEVVLDAALSAADSWRAAGHPIGISVNVSPRSLLDPAFPDLVARRIGWHGVPAEWVTLELTESLNLGRLDMVDRALAALRRLGVRIALDDFGTGTSSLTALARVPVDELKIDRSFIAALGSSDESTAVVRSAIELGRSLGLSVVAEGVESQQQRAMLFELGVATGQGHLFSRAIPARRFGTILDRGGELATPMSTDAQVIRIPAARLARGNRHRL